MLLLVMGGKFNFIFVTGGTIVLCHYFKHAFTLVLKTVHFLVNCVLPY